MSNFFVGNFTDLLQRLVPTDTTIVPTVTLATIQLSTLALIILCALWEPVLVTEFAMPTAVTSVIMDK